MPEPLGTSRGKGIPQGYSASDILAKAYFFPIDLRLREEGRAHLRYVDDIRVFCRSRIEAQQVIRQLFQLTHQRGLSLQSAKTDILSVEDARNKFNGVDPVIKSVQAQLRHELLAAAEEGGDYVSPAELLRMLERSEGEPPEVLERTFRERFLTPDTPFDKTLFHYLLVRLAKLHSSMAVDYCIEVLISRPEETEHVLRYLGDVVIPESQLEHLVSFITSEQALYEYQVFQVLRWFYEKRIYDVRMRDFARMVAFNRNRDPWLRSYAIAYIGTYAFVPDFDRLEEEYAVTTSEVEKADIAAALYMLEATRRNAIYGRIQGDAEMVRRAVSLVRQEHP